MLATRRRPLDLSKLLKEQLKAELEYDRDQLIDKQHWLTLEQIFIEKKVYQKIEKAKTAEAVRTHIVNERQAGRAVLLFSEDLEEVIDMSDVVLVMFQGKIVGEFTRDEIDIDEIGLLMTGSMRAEPVGAP